MAEENRTWGYERLQGALSNLGHTVAQSTIANILKARGHRSCSGAEQKDDVERIPCCALGDARSR